MSIVRFLGSALLAVGLAGAQPAAAAAPTIVVSDAWVRATPPGAMAAAAYFVLTNSGALADRLVEAHCDVASEATVHVTALVDGVYQMRDGALEVPAHGTARLSPQGSHLMLMGLHAPLRAGSAVALTLRFAHAGTVRVAVPVRPATGTEP